MKYENNQLVGQKVEKLHDVLKRGMWRYDLTDAAFTPQQVTLDNGVTMNLSERQNLIDAKKQQMKERKKMMQVLKEPEVEKKDLKKGKLPAKGVARKK